MMSEERVRRITAWHDRAYREDAQRTPFQVAYLGLHLTMHPDVQPITPMSDLLGRAVLDEVNATDRVLDMGTGCGVNAILAASTATDVVAVDINPHAVACARHNAVFNGVASHIDIRHSDLFTGVAGAFDLIIFDPPFRWLHPRDVREANMTDGNYATLTAFFAQVGEHLAPGGRILLFFGTTGDIAYVHHLVERSGLRRKQLASRHLDSDELDVDYFTFRLTPAR